MKSIGDVILNITGGIVPAHVVALGVSKFKDNLRFGLGKVAKSLTPLGWLAEFVAAASHCGR